MINTRCWTCAHYFGAWHCRAFPDGIPEYIQMGEGDHSVPIEGDSGIVYKKADASLSPAEVLVAQLESAND